MKIILIIYTIFLATFSLFSYLFIDQNLIYLQRFYTGFANLNREVVSIVYFVILVVLFAFYVYFLRKITKKILIILILISICSLFFSYPAILSYDIFNYIFTAKVLFLYKENPFIIMPIEFLGDPMLLFTHAANKVALYGPSWVGITGAPYLLGFNNFILTLFNFKAVVLLFYLGIIYLIYKITNNLDNVAYFALSPLVLIETLVSGHNDVSMMFFALLAIYLLKKERIILAFSFLAISILIKYATIFLILVFIYFLFLKLKKRKVEWERVNLYSFLSMFLIFFLSPIRGEVYPWYGIWFLVFIPLLNIKALRIFGIVISFSLLLRYIPYMYLGTYFGLSAVLRESVTYIPLFIFVIIYKFLPNKLRN